MDLHVQDHCKSAISFISPKEIRIKVLNCKTLYSMPMKTVGLILALLYKNIVLPANIISKTGVRSEQLLSC